MDKLYFKKELYDPSMLIDSLHRRRELTKGRKEDKYMNLGNYRKDVDNEEILRLYNSGVSMKKISEKVGLSYGSVRFRLAKMGAYRIK